jgi:hypothetical protein
LVLCGFSSVLLDVVREFVAFSESGGVRGRTLDRVCELMVVLRRAGFSGGEIERLSGGRWLAGNIRTYTSGWGGVDDSLVREKEDILSLLREFSSSGRSLADVSAVLALDRSVKAKESSVDEVAELWGYLREDVQPCEVGKMLEFYRGAKDEGLTYASMKLWRKKDEELAGLGFNKGTREVLLEVSVQSGGVYNAIMNLMEYNKLADKRAAAREAVAAAEEATRRRLEEVALYNQFKESREGYTTLLLMRWTLPALIVAPEVLKRADTTEKRIAISSHLELYDYEQVGKELRLVKRRKASRLEPAELTRRLLELRTSCILTVPLVGYDLIKLTRQLGERLPGFSVGDYARFLSSQPNASEQERSAAKYLLNYEEESKKEELAVDPDDLWDRLGLLRFQCHVYELMLRGLRSRIPDPDQVTNCILFARIAAKQIPPNVDMYETARLVYSLLEGFTEAAQKNETISEEEKMYLDALRENLGGWLKIRPARARLNQAGNQTAQPASAEATETPRSQAPNPILNRFPPKATRCIIEALFAWKNPNDARLEVIANDLIMDVSEVREFRDYLMKDPSSRGEVKRLGYSDDQIPGWVASSDDTRNNP